MRGEDQPSPFETIKATLDFMGYRKYKIQPHPTFIKVTIGMNSAEFLAADATKAQSDLISWLQRLQ